MKPTEKQATGDLGETEVDANFQRIGWAPSVKFRQDIGDDLLTVARDERGNDLGLPVVYQVKSSWEGYSRPAATDGDEQGWWYEDSDPRHFDHWVKHGLPQLLVLHDLKTRTSYWVHVTGDRIVSTGIGSKIFVPSRQMIDREHLADLLTVSSTSRARISLEGSAWTGAFQDIGPSDLLRYALIAPRLIAPHGNQHHESLTSHQGVALIAGVRLDQYRQAAHEGSAPTPPAMREHREWAWRFAGALHQLLLGEGTDSMRRLLAEARHPHEVVAARVVIACWLWEDEEYDSSLEMLIAPNDASDADGAWILAQRARVLVSEEKVDEAILAAQHALERLALLTSDVTASALRSSAVWTLYNATAFGQGDLGQAIAASDNAVTWWRSQQVLRGLTYAGEDRFNNQFDLSHRLPARSDDRGHNHLTGALWNAALASDQTGWKSAAKTLAVHTLTTEADRSDIEIREALSLLRRGGHARELANAVQTLWESGPTDLLAGLADDRRALGQTYVEERATLAFWKGCGDLLSTARADEAIKECLELVTPPDSVARSPYGGASARIYDVVPAIVRILPAASKSTNGLVASYLAEHISTDAVTAQALRPLLRALPLAEPEVRAYIDPIRIAAEGLNNYQGQLILATLAHDDPSARDAIEQLATAGNDLALANRVSLGHASPDELNDFLNRRMSSTSNLIARSEAAAERGEVERDIGGPDTLAELTWISKHVQSLEGLQSVLDALFNPAVPSDAKRESIWSLVAPFKDLPDGIKEALRRELAQDSSRLTTEPGPLLAIQSVAQARPPSDIRSATIRLMRSPAADERGTAALVVGYSRLPDTLGLLTASMVDASARVRATASTCVAYFGATEPGAEGDASLLLRTALEQDGFLVAQMIGQCLREHQGHYADVREALLRSPSAIVRKEALGSTTSD